MRILLVYPEHEDTFWSLKQVTKYLAQKALYPPLGLLTVAALLPRDWEKKVVDMNVKPLDDADLEWADYVFLSALTGQHVSARMVIKRCNALGVKVVAGGPMFTIGYDEFEGVDHFVLGEAESNLPIFLEDLERGHAKRLYEPGEWPDITRSPIPLWELVDIQDYFLMSIQYCRGCPFDCEFCDINVLNGRKPRTKSKEQLIAEMEALYALGWRAGVSFVDDNIVGNRFHLQSEILPAMQEWTEKRGYPFSFFTQASLHMADDDEFLKQMAQVGFDSVFVGIETTDEDCLLECGKHHNRGRDLAACVRRIQNHGIEVHGGFIVGFDHDTPSIFDRMIDFIQRSGVVVCQLSLLKAPRGTRLYKRMEKEGRLLSNILLGGCADLNFIPKMNLDTLINGYLRMVRTLYAPKEYYERIGVFLNEFKPCRNHRYIMRFHHFTCFLRILWALGVRGEGKRYFWKLFMFTLFYHPKKFRQTITLAAYRFHFGRLADNYKRELSAHVREQSALRKVK